MPTEIAAKKVVSIHYTLKSDVGDVLDTSCGGTPLLYLHGSGNIVPGLERQLDGKNAGDKLIAIVPAVEGYGEREGPGPQAVPVTAFDGADLRPGMSLMVEDESGQQMPLWVVAVEGDQVLVDGNHPLAGETLHFDVEIVEVRDATDDELAHGHVHDGDHGHGHGHGAAH